MEDLKLVKPFDEILYKPTELVDFEKIDHEDLIKKMGSVINANSGVGLSANQVGLPYRMFILKLGHEMTGIFNPTIVERSGEKESHLEGCLSFPKLLIKVNRSPSVRLRFIDAKGVIGTKQFGGYTARIIQHEVDHLDGIPFWFHISKFKLKRAIEVANKKYGANYDFRDFYHKIVEQKDLDSSKNS